MLLQKGLVFMGKEDIEELVQTRIIVLRAANKLADDVDMSEVEFFTQKFVLAP